MQEWAICMPGTFSRLAPHVGALHALLTAYQEGKLLKEPAYICTSSVAGIPASIAVQRSEEKFLEIEHILLNLRKKHFVSLHPDLKKRAAIDFVSMLGLIISAHATGKIQDPVKRYLALLSMVPVALKISEKAVKDIFNCKSFLTYDNDLFPLLMSSFDFDAIFNSPIKIEMPSVNLNKAGWRLDQILSSPPLYLDGWHNEGWVSVTNFKPEDKDLEPDIRNRKYVRKLINGLRVYGHFAPGRHENDDPIADTAALSNMPIHFAIKQGYTNIVVLHYNSTTEAPINKPLRNWVETLNREVDLNVSENSRKTELGYLRVNNDLKELDKQNRDLEKLEEMIKRQGVLLDDSVRETVEKYIKATRDAHLRLSYARKKKINLYFVDSEPLPDIHFSSFNTEQLREGINKGWRAGWNAIPRINEMISA